MSRIALLTPYAQPVLGGISTFVSGLARLLRRRGHEVAIFAAEGNGDTPDRSDLGAGSSFRREARDGLQEFAPDVVHAHAHWYTISAAARYAAGAADTRLVFSFHTTTTPWWNRLFERLLSRAHVVTFVSCAQLEELRRLLHLGGDLRILRPATELPTNSDQSRDWAQEKGFRGANPLLSMVSPLEYPQKVRGVIELVRAMRTVRQDFPEAKLLLVGDGRLRGAVEQEAIRVGSAVEMLGYMADPSPVFEATDIYCHISRQEGLPIALLEAMAHGLAVVATRVGGIPEVVDGANGLLVDGQEELPRAIVRLASDRELRGKLGAEARETIREAHTWDARWSTVSSIYGLD